MSFRLSIAQQPLAWQDAAANRAHFAAVLAPLAGTTDLVVLPEMFTTGFTMKPEAVTPRPPTARRAPGCSRRRARSTRRWAAAWRSTITAATTTASCSRCPDGLTYWYDKRHLFRMGGEHRHYSAGVHALHHRMARHPPVSAGVLRPALPGLEPAPARARLRPGRSTRRTGRRRAATPGRRCCARAPSRTRRSSPA